MRSIPTCVGQPLRTGGRRTPAEVYPHVCGAAAGRDDVFSPGEGLSPRVWGSLINMNYLSAC